MNKRLITGLVILMGVALLGIVAVQFYWFNNSVKVRNELFDRSVNDAITKAAIKLENNHNFKLIQQFSHNADSFDWHTAPPPPPVPQDIDVVIQRDSSNKREIRVFSNPKRPIRRPLLRRDDTTLTHNLGRLKVIASQSATHDSNDSLTETTNHIEVRIGEKAEQLEIFAQKMVFEFNDWEIGKNIDTEQLNKNIRSELDDKNIPIDFKYAIMARDSIVTSNLQDAGQHVHNWYKTTLYPNDIFRKNLELAVYLPDRDVFIGKTTTLLLGLSVIFTLVILITFILSITFILRQKKISEIKSDFINNMTHEFKTPIATISVAADSIINERVIGDSEKVRFFTGMIKKENKRMNEQVERILQIARLDRKDFDFRLHEVDAHTLIEDAIESISLQVEKRGGQIATQLDAEKSVINTDPTHFTNLIYNLLDNANKYSPHKPEIKVKTLNDSEGLSVIVEDKGIGMTKAVIGKIFEKFYRQTSGNIHNVKGFGLGLSYVKAILEANKGDIRVQSEPGKGSRFTVFIPFTTEN